MKYATVLKYATVQLACNRFCSGSHLYIYAHFRISPSQVTVNSKIRLYVGHKKSWGFISVSLKKCDCWDSRRHNVLFTLMYELLASRCPRGFLLAAHSLYSSVFMTLNQTFNVLKWHLHADQTSPSWWCEYLHTNLINWLCEAFKKHMTTIYYFIII